jgi:hypothetical protein
VSAPIVLKDLINEQAEYPITISKEFIKNHPSLTRDEWKIILLIWRKKTDAAVAQISLTEDNKSFVKKDNVFVLPKNWKNALGEITTFNLMLNKVPTRVDNTFEVLWTRLENDKDQIVDQVIYHLIQLVETNRNKKYRIANDTKLPECTSSRGYAINLIRKVVIEVLNTNFPKNMQPVSQGDYSFITKLFPSNKELRGRMLDIFKYYIVNNLDFEVEFSYGSFEALQQKLNIVLKQETVTKTDKKTRRTKKVNKTFNRKWRELSGLDCVTAAERTLLEPAFAANKAEYERQLTRLKASFATNFGNFTLTREHLLGRPQDTFAEKLKSQAASNANKMTRLGNLANEINQLRTFKEKCLNEELVIRRLIAKSAATLLPLVQSKKLDPTGHKLLEATLKYADFSNRKIEGLVAKYYTFNPQPAVKDVKTTWHERSETGPAQTYNVSELVEFYQREEEA